MQDEHAAKRAAVHAAHAGAAAAPTSGPIPVSSNAQFGAAALLAVESKVRVAATETELFHVVVNEMRKLVSARQVVLLRSTRDETMKVACVSSLVLGDQDTPFVRWIESMVRQLCAEHGSAAPVSFELPAFADADAPETRTYPFRHVVWQPMRLASGETVAGLLAARERPWSDQDRKLLERQAGVFVSAWAALHGSSRLKPRRRLSRPMRIAAAVLAAAAALCPVPMTVLAPVEIVAAQPQRVTAPIDAVVKEILVDPNRPVRAGTPLLRFDETTLRNRLHLAEQEMRLAKARSDRWSQAAFVDDKARHELALAKAELDLKKAERDYAADLLSRSVIYAERSGFLVYADKAQWIGRPVRTGERIMEIVDPADVAARIELPVADAIVLASRARVRLFLDLDPLSAVPGTLTSEGYHALPNSMQQLVYRLHAEIDAKGAGHRIGARGTAQVMGAYVPLAYYLLRRPISAARQYIGL